MARKPTGGKTGGQQSASSAKARREQQRKPVTIDLTATEVEKPAESAGKAEAASAKPDVVRETAKEAAKEAVAKTAAASSTQAKPSATAPQPANQSASNKSGADSSATPKPKEPPKEKPAATAAANADKTKRPAPETSSRNSFGALLAAGIVGGAIVLAGGLIAMRLGLITPGQDTGAVAGQVSDLEAGLAALDGKAGTAADEASAAITDLTTRVDTAEQALAGAAASLPQLLDMPATISDLAARIDTLEAQQQGSAGGDPANLADIQTRLAALESATAPANATSGSTDTGPLQSVLAQLRDRVTTLETAPQTAVSGLRDESNALSGQVQSLAERNTALGEQVQALAGKADTHETRLASLATQLEASDPSATLAELGSTAAAAATDASRALNAAMGVAPAVAALSLVDALETGRPFTDELAAVGTLVPDIHVPEGLSARAETGLPAISRIADGFTALMPDILTEKQATEKPTGTVARLVKGMRAIVEVRPAGPVEGDGTFAIVSRIADNLAAGDLASALAQWDQLDDDAKALSQTWHNEAASLRDAKQLADQLRRNAMARLGSGS